MSLSLNAFIQGSTVRIEATIADYDSDPNNPTYLDCDSNQVNVNDEQGNAVSSMTILNAAITHDSLGHYHGEAALPSNGTPGTWRAVWTATISSKNYKGSTTFQYTN